MVELRLHRLDIHNPLHLRDQRESCSHIGPSVKHTPEVTHGGAEGISGQHEIARVVVQCRFLVLHGHAAFFDGVAGGFVRGTVVGLVLVVAVGHDLAAGAEK